MQITILTEAELRRCVEVDEEAIAAVEEGFSALGEGRAVTPPIMRVDIEPHHGEVDVKSAYIEGLDSFAVKAASGFYENYKLGLPSGSGLMLLWSAKIGVPEAILLDNGYLTNVRTAAAGAIAARHLAPDVVGTAGVVGAGAQGRYQMEALKLVRDYERVIVHDVDGEAVAKYVEVMAPVLGVEVLAAESEEMLVRESDVVVTSTPSSEPHLMADWLHSGLHITAMGSDAEHKQELEAAVLGRADRRVCDLKSQVFRLGEHHHALAAGVIGEDDPLDELGEITSGQKPGRTSAEEITVCDLTGTGVQDTAIALLAYRKAQEKGLGLQIEA